MVQVCHINLRYQSAFCYNHSMEISLSNHLNHSEIRCSQCGGELHPDEGQNFLVCPYCNTAVYLDKTQVVFHWFLASTLDEPKARAALAHWMAGNQTVKDLDKKSRLVSHSFEYFPIWYFKRKRPTGQEEILLEPAAATSISELRNLKLLAGDLRKYHSQLDAEARQPTAPLQTALHWLEEKQIATDEIVEKALVHIPLFIYKYIFKGQTYTAVVEGGTGAVFANLYPAKSEAPYLAVGILAAVIFLCLAAVPVVGALSGEEGAFVGLGICVGVGILAAPILFGLAVWVAAKI